MKAKAKTPISSLLFDPDKLYTPNEASARLGVHRSTVIRWIDAGKINAFQVGERGLRIPGNDLNSQVKPVGSKAMREAGLV